MGGPKKGASKQIKTNTHKCRNWGPRGSPGAGGRPRVRGPPGTSDSLFKKMISLTCFLRFFTFYNSAVTREFNKPHLFPQFFNVFAFVPLFPPFFSLFNVSGHVEVGSSSKEPAFDLFARVGRRGLRDRLFFGPGKGVPPLCCQKVMTYTRSCVGKSFEIRRVTVLEFGAGF